MRPATSGRGSGLAVGWEFIRENKWAVLGLSALIAIPCWWHRYIEAGDLGSHVYNAWLAQLIGKGQAPGLYIARQWNNILFDVSLLHVANVVGFAMAEKIVVSACVLIFFWGVFVLVGAVTRRAPWFLTPCIAMLAYGYTFNMGFLNYYLSIGLGSLCLAFVGRGWAGNWVPALVLATLALLAHPLGFLWTAGTIAYLSLQRLLPGRWKVVTPVGASAAIAGISWYLYTRTDLAVDWRGLRRLYELNGADQLALYGHRYLALACVALIFGLFCFLGEAWRRREAGSWKAFAMPLELYCVAWGATVLLPENLRLSIYAGWIGLLVSRLTTISAILGLCVLGSMCLKKWALAGFAGLAVVYFLFLYQDTGALNRMESNAVQVLSEVPPGTRIVPTIRANPEWRIAFIVHLADRACVGRCFVYSNYEPSSGQFRVRARKGSRIATDSAEDAEDMQGGVYEIQQGDLPVKQLYQCDRADWTKLCLRDLAEGNSTGEVGFQPGG